MVIGLGAVVKLAEVKPGILVDPDSGIIRTRREDLLKLVVAVFMIEGDLVISCLLYTSRNQVDYILQAVEFVLRSG